MQWIPLQSTTNSNLIKSQCVCISKPTLDCCDATLLLKGALLSRRFSEMGMEYIACISYHIHTDLLSIPSTQCRSLKSWNATAYPRPNYSYTNANRNLSTHINQTSYSVYSVIRPTVKLKWHVRWTWRRVMSRMSSGFVPKTDNLGDLHR